MHAARLRCAATAAPDGPATTTAAPTKPRRVVVLGGAGRVGGSAGAALAGGWPGIDVTVAGRDPPAPTSPFAAAPFLRVDAGDVTGMAAALREAGADLVIHTAGPFQGGGAGAGADADGVPAPLAAAIEAGVPYVDVCDDAGWARSALAADARAKAAGVPCITTAGVFPGLSGLLGAALVDAVTCPPPPATASAPTRLRYSYFVAGSGGAGPAVLAATLLLAGTPAAAWRDGERVTAPPWSQPMTVDFGRGVGRKRVALIDLPEVEAAAVALGVPSVSARFGTAPAAFNVAMAAFAALAPRSWVTDGPTAARVAGALAPIVAAGDALAGDRTVAIRADLETGAGESAAAVYVHRDMAAAVGLCTAAFGAALLDGAVPPGVWRPEALPRGVRESILERAKGGSARCDVGVPGWAVDSDPKRLGFGMYW